MARAKRHYIPGFIWHITHRCHKREFLLKFSRDRHRYLQWLYQAKKRYGLMILNYMVTSNHVHLLVVDDGERDVIPNSMQLVAGRTGQEYNQYHKGWVEEYLGNGGRSRDEEWTDSIAVGSKSFVERVKALLGFRAKGRDVIEGPEGGYQVREGCAPYNAVFEAKKGDIGPQNTYFWDSSTE